MMSAEPILADAPWLTAGGTARVLELLNANGEEARVVGGAVRNALLALAPGGIDIATAARRVRFIGDPDQRIAEDYLRILRFFRIHAAFGAGDPDRDGYLACIRGRAGLAHLSAERVRMEM